MPEGHTVHRIAGEFRKYFVGDKVAVTSPQGRFSRDAAQVSGKEMIAASAVGKQMFLEFENNLHIRIHLGIYGKWEFEKPVQANQAPWGQVRARFVSSKQIANLRGPTACEVITGEQVLEQKAKLGPDPIPKDPTGAELERFITRVSSSSSAIGLLLMNQAVIAGVGNVYRAELLFRQRINPFTAGKNLGQTELENLWLDAAKLMRFGVKQGIMVTRDEYLGKKTPLEERYFVYRRAGEPCRVCGKKLKMQELASRKLYFCPSCQK